MIGPGDEGNGEGDGGEEGAGALVIAGVDAAPVLETGEHVLDAITLSVERPVVGYMDPAIDFGGDAGGDAAFGERLAEPVGVMAPVGEHGGGGWQGIDQQGGAFEIAGLPFGQHQANGTAAVIPYGMELGGQSAAAAPDTLG